MNRRTRTPGPPKLAGARVAVVGAGRSGLSLTRFLLSRGASVHLTDIRSAAELAPEVSKLGRRGVDLRLGGHDVKRLVEADLVAVSPGVPLASPPLHEARQRGARLLAEVEIAARSLQGMLIGITGSNGKSTTTALTAHILAHAGLPATACGNLGTPLSDLIENDTAGHYYIVELSSFQLEGIETLRPKIGVLLNLSPDHLDRYPDRRAYYRAKARLFMNQSGSDHAVLNRDDREVWKLSRSIRARIHPFSRTRKPRRGAALEGNRITLRPDRSGRRSVPLDTLPLFGPHNIENAMAALLIADLCGVPPERAIGGLSTFRGLPHRLEKVAEIDGVSYYNDSKATNVAATTRSLESFPRDVVLILGGRDKGGAFADLRSLIRKRVTHLILMGEARESIASQVGTAVPTTSAGSMDEAVRVARGAAAGGGVVLLAPGCASFDQYGSFEERGEDFRRRVLQHAGGGARGAGRDPLTRKRPPAPAA